MAEGKLAEVPGELENSVLNRFSVSSKGRSFSVKLEAREEEESTDGAEGVTSLEAVQIQVISDETSQMYSLRVDQTNVKRIFPHCGGTLASFHVILCDLFAKVPATLAVFSVDLACGAKSLEIKITSSMPYNSFVCRVILPAEETSETKRLQHQVLLLLQDKREAEKRFNIEMSEQRELFKKSMMALQEEFKSYIQTEVVQELEAVRAQVGSVVIFPYGWVHTDVRTIDVASRSTPTIKNPSAYFKSSGEPLSMVSCNKLAMKQAPGNCSELYINGIAASINRENSTYYRIYDCGASPEAFFLRPHAHFTLYSSDQLMTLRLCPSIKKLNLTGNKEITHLKFLAKLGALEELNLSGCTGVSSLQIIPFLSNLQKLDVSGCRKIIDLQPLKKMEQLKTLNITDTGVTNRLSVSEMIGLTITG